MFFLRLKEAVTPDRLSTFLSKRIEETIDLTVYPSSALSPVLRQRIIGETPMLRYRFPVFGPFPYYLLFSAFNHTRHGIMLAGRTYRELRIL